jgi:hypothetical protein
MITLILNFLRKNKNPFHQRYKIAVDGKDFLCSRRFKQKH